MYRKNNYKKTGMRINTSYEGVTIEKRVAALTEQKTPITDSSPLIYTERKDGVLAGHDIRTDRFEVAVDAMNKVTEQKRALNKKEDTPEKPVDNKGDGGAEPIEATTE